MAEFLPLCDVLFNVISLAGYFCDVVFDVVLGYALFKRGRTAYFVTIIVLVSISLIVSQIVSLRWYFNNNKKLNSIDSNKKNIQLSSTTKIGRMIIISLHFTQMGVLWRYAKLFVPVDLRHVKHEVRDLCMLRLVHAFFEAAPMLLLQLHVLFTIQNENNLISNEIKLKSYSGHLSQNFIKQTELQRQQQQRTFNDLNIVSVILSLFSVCWALASFSKNVRLQNVHRLVLTWLGVIFQFFWRLGTVTSRIISLTVYASCYSYWVFLVIVLHWISMFLWLISPKNVFHGERISRVRKALLAGMIAFVYVFAYINLQEVNHRQKMITFYVVMFLENWLLVCLWLVGIWNVRSDLWYMVPILVVTTFLTGIFFLFIYYRYFHVRRLGYEAGGRFPLSEYKKYHQCSNICKCNATMEISRNCLSQNDNHLISDEIKYSHVIPGVFNCRFSNPVGNGATKRKKKKPTSFIPPPTLGINNAAHNSEQLLDGPMAIPFWRKPLPRSLPGSSENEGSVESRVNIHQKLQEKKQKQLAELKIIEEEIKQGKLGTISSGDDGKTSLPRQPIPRVKKHIDLDPINWHASSPEHSFNKQNLEEINNLNKFNGNFDSINNPFGLNGINISSLAKFTNEAKDNFGGIENTNRNMSPISSQISATESNSLTRQVLPRTKIPHNIIRNPFAENYRGHLGNIYADAAVNNNNRPISISPRNTENNNSNRAHLYEHHGGLYLEVNHPRQISGTYSSSVENSAVENLAFPYNVIPPPRSKLDSRMTPTAPTNSGGNTSYHPQKNNLNNNIHSNCNNNNNNANINKFNQQRQIQRAKTPEILLAPHYLENTRIYYDWVTRDPTVYRLQDGNGDRNHTVSSGDENLEVSAADESVFGFDQSGNRIPSDIDSQVSLPRSYTLPREFKYYRRNKARKVIKNEHFIASTNSSDGDVDSGDDNESEHQSNLSNPNSSNSQQKSSTQQIVNSNNIHYDVQKASNNFNISPKLSIMKVDNRIIGMSPVNHPNTNQSNQFLPLINGGAQNYNNFTQSSKAVNNLDLINGVDNNVMNRMRMRVYGVGKVGMIRHETKL